MKRKDPVVGWPGVRALATDFMGPIMADAGVKRVVLREVKVRRMVGGRRKTYRVVASARIYMHGGSRIFLHNPPDYWQPKRRGGK